eukprot:3946_1
MHSLVCKQRIAIILIAHLIDGLLSETINCDNEWDTSECYTQTVSCNDTSTSCAINCSGLGSCAGATLNCNDNTQCVIHCSGDNSCRGAPHDSTINCAPNSQCNVHCDGLHSCEELNIHCPSTSNCTLYANGQYAFINAWVGCQSGANGCLLTMNCNDINSCHDARVDARNASQVTIKCANNKNACKDINVECPQAQNGDKVCAMRGDEGTMHTAMRIYAVNSWDDIDLSQYVAKTITSGTLDSMMFCDDKLDKSCVVSTSSWNCGDVSSVCYRNSSDIHPYPTPIPTAAPISSGPDDDHLTSWAVIIGLIVGLFMFCLFVILGYVWCVRQKHIVEKKYETLDQDEDPDADIMQKQSQHMYRTNAPLQNKNRKSMDIPTKGGFHIVNEYSDASKFGGLLPISEEKSKNGVVEEEKQTLVASQKDTSNVVTVVEEENEANTTNDS